MLVMKAWFETRWRLLASSIYLLLVLAANYQRHNSGNSRGMLMFLGAILVLSSVTLAGSGVRSQAPIGFPEGLVGSTQFTIALPVSRLRLLILRTAVGIGEILSLTAVCGALTWALFPSVRAISTPVDFIRLLLTVGLVLPLPYCASALFTTFLDEPWSLLYSSWALLFLLWLIHRIVPALDILLVLGQSSPLITHRMPWTQLATAIGIAGILFLIAVRVVQSRE